MQIFYLRILNFWEIATLKILKDLIKIVSNYSFVKCDYDAFYLKKFRLRLL
jgi:hypothetical protein